MKERILILSADANLRQWLVDILRAAHVSLETAANGPAGLALLAEREFDLVLVDADLPGMDGLETLWRIKNHAPRTGSLVLARKQSEELLLRSMRSGGGDFLRIPCNPDEVARAAERQLKLSTRQRQQGPDRNEGPRKTLVRAFQSICLSLDLQGVPGRPLPGLQPLGLVARQVALGLKLGETARQEIQLATWIQAICDLPGDAPITIDWEELPSGVQALLEQGEGPAAQVVQLALAFGRGDDIYEKGRFDPAMLEFMPKGPQFKQGQRRAQLSRARALQDSGQNLEAVHLFEQVLKAEPNSPEVLLSLARLHRKPELVQQALSCSQKLGSWITAETCFEGGLVLHELNAPGADNLFQRSSRLYGDLRSRHRQALATLAQEWVAGAKLPAEVVRSAVDDLCSCPEPELLSAQVDWLAPGFSAHAADRSEATRLVQRWLEEDSSRIASEIRRGSWNLDARKGLARILSGLPWLPGREVLEVLEKDHSEEVRAAVPAEIHVGAALPPILRIHALGALSVYQGRRRLANNAWRTQRARRLVAYLATHWQETHSEESLIELFLPDSPSPARFQQLLEVARASLRPAGWPEVNYLLWEDGKLRFNLQLPRWVDVEQSEQSFARARQCQGEQAADLYRRVLAVDHGEFLEDFEEDWVLPRRVRQREQLLEARFWLARWSLEGGRPAEALEHAQSLLEAAPGSEEAWVLSLDSLLALNRIEEALRTSDRAKKAVAEPGPLLKEAHRRAVASLA